MRGGGKNSSKALTHRLRSSLLPKGGGYPLDDGFCDSAFGCAQNDSFSEGVQVPYWNEGSPKFLTCDADSTPLVLPA